MNTKRPFIFLNKIALCFLISVSSISATAQSTPDEVIEKLHSQLIENMQGGEQLSFDDRYKKLDPIIRSSFDFSTIARVIMGSHWRSLSEIEQAEFIETFTKLSISNYASQFKGYNEEQFTTLADEEQKKGRILVLTEFKTSERNIAFNYLLQPDGETWRIINVVVDGVSDLSLKRSDYGAILKNEGFNELVRKLQEKIELSETPPVE